VRQSFTAAHMIEETAKLYTQLLAERPTDLCR
jgi:hypothetical protein